MSEPDAQLTLPVSERDHVRGNADAPITLVEYGDYECPYCSGAYTIVKEIQQQMGDRLRFVFRNFPLTQAHVHAQKAAEAAEIAGDSGKFWEMHDMLYENQKALNFLALREYAEDVGLDGDAFEEALEARTKQDRVREDFMSGVRSGVNATPTFFINGFRHDGGYGPEELLRALESAEL